MSQLLQSYGTWIVVGILLLVLLVLFARTGGNRKQEKRTPQTGESREKHGQDGDSNRHS